MRFLETERGCLESFLPGLDKYLTETPLHELERRGNGALATFREVNGPGLLVPTEFGGAGASLLEAVRIQRAIGSRSPSLAVATTMHHFSVASLVELTVVGEGFEWAMLTAVAENSWLLSSGFAEGKPGQHILSPGMVGVRVDGGLRVSGRKRPCSLTWSMNLMSASVRVMAEGSDIERMAIILIPAESEGIVRREFWQSWALAGAESDEVELNDVFVPDALVFYPEVGESMDPIQARGFVYFELLIAAAYLGAVSGLAEKVITSQKVSAEERTLMAIELESAAAGLEYVAMLFHDAESNSELLARALYARYGVERCIERVAMTAAAGAGGMEFIGSSDVVYLLGVSRALAFHPPSRAAANGPLSNYMAGAELIL